ncbi:MAG: ABC transporter ATP-binding protein [Oceanisphaera sp.]|uniref:ABC transporter ATP-binding protein n=1 Tax=Oceanisphaera sp. TaxID=1929979 RepID=UPI003F9BA50E
MVTHSQQVIIEVQNLVSRFGSHVVHDQLDLSVYRGEILGVVGGSGTGKSVLLRSIVGLRQPNGGTVQLLGHNILDLAQAKQQQLQQRMGVLFQKGALYSSLTLQENIALALIEQVGLSRQEAAALAMIKLGLVGLARTAADKYPAELSGGMVKRAALARALALDPDILFLDEPTAGLDPIGAAAFDRLLLTLRDALKLTVFLVTHDLDTLYACCDRVAVLSQQRVLVVDSLPKVALTDDPWIRDYFRGPRGRSAQQSADAFAQE